MCNAIGQAVCELKNMPLSGDKQLDDLIKKWIKWDRNQETLCQIMTAVRKEDWDTLRARLTNRIAFGTAGLRAVMRAGFDSMNDLVVVQSAQGLCEYLKAQYPNENTWADRGVAVGFDGRYNSYRFAELTTIVFLSNNFRVYQFKETVATPFVSYTVVRMGCLAGVMVTASHNPKQDNGYKIFWTNGAQVTTPHEEGIAESILNNLQPQADSWDESVLCANDLLCDPYGNVVPAYFDALKKEISCPLMGGNGKCSISFVYTAMHGVGYPFVKMAFSKINLNPVLPVCEQCEPDPEFTTTPIPNPEEGKTSLNLAIQLATANKCDIILANDPDADRLAVAEVDGQKYKVFSGNELGALLGWWALEAYRKSAENVNVSNCAMVASTVSSKILRSMAEIEGFAFHETLTGFKWIANKALDEQNAGRKVLFAFEEAIGFMVSTNVPDKDGVSAAAHVATMACYLRCQKCMTLQEKLRDIYETYGYHTTIVSYVICRDKEKMLEIFNRLRSFDNDQANTYPTSIMDGEYEIESVRDLNTGFDSSRPDKKAILPLSTGSQMITFTFTNGAVVTLRASGTEPKMKYYAEMCGKPENKRWEDLSDTLKRMVAAVVNEFYEPEKNGLERRRDE